MPNSGEKLKVDWKRHEGTSWNDSDASNQDIPRLPRWSSGWESACQCRGHQFDSGPGRSHMPRDNQARPPQLLSLCAAPAGDHTPRRLCAAAREAAPVRSLCTAPREQPSLTSTREKSSSNKGQVQSEKQKQKQEL